MFDHVPLWLCEDITACCYMYCYFRNTLQWNQLPVVVQEADTLSTFKSRLKTFLFDKAYS